VHEVLLSESAEHTIRQAAKQAHPAETGGVLLGVWARGRPWVTQAMVIAPEQPSPNRYVLPSGATHTAVARGRQHDSRIGYLGDWHVHPADIDVSPIDESTMKALTPDNPRAARSPVFLIARRRSSDYELEAFEWRHDRRRQLSVLRAGGLPAPPS